MIAACPKCSARYRIEKEKLGPEGARLKCTRCEAVFRVRSPEPRITSEITRVVAAPVAPTPVAAPAATGAGAAQPQSAAEESHDRSRLVLVADPGIEEGKATASALAAWGLQPILVHDGVEAILTIARTLPCTVIIDAALPKMYGFQVCEVLKRNESLRSIHVVLVGAIHDRNRYRRTPTELYGADAYLERPQLPDSLWPILRELGVPLAGVAPTAEGARDLPFPMRREESVPAPRPPEPAMPSPPEPVTAAAAPTEVPIPVASKAPGSPLGSPPPESVPGVVGEAEIAKAERLARIVVSDIILYNQGKFDAAIAEGNVLTALEPELREGRTLFAQRIDANVREQRDFLADELLRVAGLQGRQ